MKLLVVNWQDRLNPQAGGAEVHVHETFGRLAARGHRVSLLVSGWEGAPQRERLDGMDVHRVGGRHTFGALAPGYYRRELAREGFDAVVEALNKVPTFAPLWAGRPVVLLVHHLFGATAFREASFPLAAATWLLERPIGPVYRGVPAQAISRSTAEDLVARGLRASDVRVIYPGLDLAFYTPGPGGARLPEPTFLYLGRLRRYKGIDLVLRAVAALRDRGTHVRLLVGGKGDHEPQLRALASGLRLGDRVEFLGFVTDERKRELFRTVWANVFPSPKEGWGITNVEAAACGTATVASDSPGLRESVLDGRTGVLVPHGDVAALAAALEALARSPERVAELGSAALDFTAQFTWNRTADETEAHLLAVTAG
ncbi:MAG TPA: glycosyltransferase family 4 protein [Longimicrobiaceae bacterium]|nr:glycosyltransferase family 4 protein [Longimicrobiaceae bacterium]